MGLDQLGLVTAEWHSFLVSSGDAGLCVDWLPSFRGLLLGIRSFLLSEYGEVEWKIYSPTDQLGLFCLERDFIPGHKNVTRSSHGAEAPVG